MRGFVLVSHEDYKDKERKEITVLQCSIHLYSTFEVHVSVNSIPSKSNHYDRKRVLQYLKINYQYSWTYHDIQVDYPLYNFTGPIAQGFPWLPQASGQFQR